MTSDGYNGTGEMAAGQEREPIEPEEGWRGSFEVPNLDDLLAIAGRVRARWPAYAAEEMAALALGMRRLAEVL